MTVVAAVRLRPAPPLEPPFDDELGPQGLLIPGADQLSLDWSPTPPPTPAAARAEAVRAPGGGASPEARAAARRYVTRCLEILNGYRPAGHIRSLAAQPATAMIIEQLADGRARLASSRRLGVGAPRLLVGLGHVRICEPRPGIAEIAAVVRTAHRAWALALRLEKQRGSWLCTITKLL